MKKLDLDKALSHYNESSSLQTNKKEKANTYNYTVIYSKDNNIVIYSKKSIIEKLLDAFKNLLKNVFKN
jgi:predicted alpha/beta superfamily hydrolase